MAIYIYMNIYIYTDMATFIYMAIYIYIDIAIYICMAINIHIYIIYTNISTNIHGKNYHAVGNI